MYFTLGLAGSGNASAGQVLFSGHVPAKQSASAALMGTVTSFKDVAAVQLNVPHEDLRVGAAIVRVRDAVGNLVASKTVAGQGSGSRSVVMFKLADAAHQEMTVCVEHGASGKPNACYRYSILRVE